jgi:hypothetical protein
MQMMRHPAGCLQAGPLASLARTLEGRTGMDEHAMGNAVRDGAQDLEEVGRNHVILSNANTDCFFWFVPCEDSVSCLEMVSTFSPSLLIKLLATSTKCLSGSLISTHRNYNSFYIVSANMI